MNYFFFFFFNYKIKTSGVVAEEEANKNATVRHHEMVYVEPVQEMIWIPGLKLPARTKCHPPTTEELALCHIKKKFILFSTEKSPAFKLVSHQ